jgi:hypothetical protein
MMWVWNRDCLRRKRAGGGKVKGEGDGEMVMTEVLYMNVWK